MLLHRLEQRRLRARRRPVDLVDQQDVREHRALDEAQAAGLEQAGAGDVAREQVRRALEPGGVEGEGPRDGPGEQRLAGARDVLDEHVAVGEERDRDQPHGLVAADDGLARRPRGGPPTGGGPRRRGRASWRTVLGHAGGSSGDGRRVRSGDVGGVDAVVEAYAPTGHAGSGSVGLATSVAGAVSSCTAIPDRPRFPCRSRRSPAFPPRPTRSSASPRRTAPTRAPGKINLSSGVFVDETGTTPVLATVIEAERRLADAAGTKLYRPIDGEVAYRELVRALVLGADHEAVVSGRALATQTPGGTGGLRVAADLLQPDGLGPDAVDERAHVAESSTAVPRRRLPRSGRTRTPTRRGARSTRRRCCPRSRARRRATSCCSTARATTRPGVDPSPALWRRIGDLVEERRLLPLVDLAYQGFGDGLREDAAGLLELVRPGVELLVSTSFSKTFSLYAERVGALVVIASSAADAAAVQSHVKAAIRTNYSNPPAHGADIVRTILADASLRARWEVELAAMRDRIKANRRALVAALEARSIPGDWSGIATQRGMFALLGLSADQVARLRDEHAVYVVGHGRINVAGFTSVEPRAVRRRARRGARLVLGWRHATSSRAAAVDPRPDQRRSRPRGRPGE